MPTFVAEEEWDSSFSCDGDDEADQGQSLVESSPMSVLAEISRVRKRTSKRKASIDRFAEEEPAEEVGNDAARRAVAYSGDAIEAVPGKPVVPMTPLQRRTKRRLFNSASRENDDYRNHEDDPPLEQVGPAIRNDPASFFSPCVSTSVKKPEPVKPKRNPRELDRMRSKALSPSTAATQNNDMSPETLI